MTYSYVKRRFCTTNLKLKPQAVCLHKVACIQLLSMCILGTFIVYTFAWCSALRERYSLLPCFPAFQIVNCFHLASTKSCTAFTLSFHIVLLLTNRDLEYIFKNSASNMNSMTPKLAPVFVSQFVHCKRSKTGAGKGLGFETTITVFVKTHLVV